MGTPGRPLAIENLLEHADWVRALARRLVASSDLADDLEQETWLAALEGPPRDASAPRRWLAQVMRNVLRQQRRSELARSAREARTARPEATDERETVERAEALRALVACVLELEEPTRSTLLLRYQDGLSTDAIAVRQGVPASTVRNRLARGHAFLRERLERRHGSAWSALLAPLAFPPSTATAAAGGGALAASIAALSTMTTLKLVSGAAAALVVGLAVWWTVLQVEPALQEPALARSAADASPALALPSEATPAERALAAGAGGEEAPQNPTPAATADRGSVVATVTWKSDRSPASGVTVRLLSWGDSSPFAFWRQQTTDEQGQARFDDLARGTAVVAPDRAAGERVEVRGGETSEVELAIPRGVLVRGRVVDREGLSVPAARIWLSEYGNHTEGGVVAVSDAAGRFELRDVGESRLIAARAKGLMPSVSQPVNGNPGDAVEILLELAQGGAELRGLVRGPDGNPLAGAAVLVFDQRMSIQTNVYGQPPQLLASDEHGQFVFTGLAAGRADVMCRARGTAPLRTSIDVGPDEVARIAIDLKPGAALEGTVRGGDGKPADSVGVVIGEYGTFLASHDLTTADGAYRLEGLAPGNTSIRFSGREQGDTQAVAALVAGETTHLDVRLETLGLVAGRVVDETGAPLAGWRVGACVPEHPGRHLRSKVTDAEGRFELDNWPAEATAIEVREDGRWAGPSALLVEEVEVGRKDLVLTVPAASRATAFVVGRLLGPQGEVVPDARLTWGAPSAIHSEFNAELSTTTGEFRVGPVPPGKYRLRGRSDMLGVLDLAVHEVVPGETLDLGELRFGLPGRLRVKLALVAGTVDATAARGASVHVLGSDGVSYGQIELDSQLEGVSAPLAPGHYSVLLSASGLRADRAQIEVVAGTEQAVELTVERATYRSFDIVWESGGPPKEFFDWRVSDMSKRVIGQAKLPAQEGLVTRFVHPGLVVGSYEARVTTADGRSGHVSFEVTDLEPSRTSVRIVVR